MSFTTSFLGFVDMPLLSIDRFSTLKIQNSEIHFKFQVTWSWKIIEYMYILKPWEERLTFSCLLIDTLIFLTGFYPNCHLSIPKWGPFKRKLFDKVDCTCRMLAVASMHQMGIESFKTQIFFKPTSACEVSIGLLCFRVVFYHWE